MNINLSDTLKFMISLSVFILVILSGIERLIWVKMESYPELLVTQHIKKVFNEDELVRLRQSCGEPLEIKHVSNSADIIRCGLFWPFRTATAFNGRNI